MPRILHKIKDPEKEVLSINQNFDNISLDLTDRSGTFSSEGSVSGLVVSAGATKTIEVDVEDVLNQYVFNNLPVVPRVDAYIDTDINDNFRYPAGPSLTQTIIHNVDVVTLTMETVFNQTTNEKATYFIIIKNRDSVSHTFYIYTQAYYLPAPDKGIALRS